MSKLKSTNKKTPVKAAKLPSYTHRTIPLPTDFDSHNFDVGERDYTLGKAAMIGAYNSRVDLDFYGSKPDQIKVLFLGIELEVEFPSWAYKYRENYAHTVKETLQGSVRGRKDFALIKHDGSLADKGAGGFEICTNPATLEYHASAWKAFFENKAKIPMVLSPRTGLHIHISKCAISALTSGKLVAFVHNPNNAAFMLLIAGRGSCQYANYERPAKHNCVLRPSSFSHYSAINAGLAKTIEFRVFSSTLNYARFMSCLEFVVALIEFLSKSGVSVMSKVARPRDFTDFLDFLKQPENKATYPHLLNFCKQNIK